MPQRSARRVALIGWDAADWKVIHPLLDRGLLPNLQSIIERGVMGNLSTLEPPLSPVLWTSIATGHTGEKHGVLGFVEPDPILGSLRPVGSTARKSKALWNILSQSGMRSIVVNWFASHPAEPIHGASVSNIFRTPTGLPGAWPLAPDAVHPAAHEEALAELRVSPADLTGDDLLPFIPKLVEIDQDSDHRVLALATILAENITTHGAATWLMEHEPWDLLAVYYDTIDHVGHLFMPYHPPRRDGIDEREFELYRGVVEGAYCFQDLMLGRLIELAGPETVFLVVSDHGFHSDHLRPSGPVDLNVEQAMGWHRPYGVLAIAGPGVRHDELVFGAGLLDIAPTVLSLFGLPVGGDMRGRVLTEAFENPLVPERIASWDDVPGEHGMITSAEETPWEAAAVIDQLAALGYVEPRTEDVARQLDAARQQQKFTLARVHLSAGRLSEGTPLLEELVREAPEERAFRLYLAQALQEARRFDGARAILDPILAEDQSRPVAQLLRGNLAIIEGDVDGGLEHLLRSESDGRPLPEMRLAIGRVYLEVQRWDDAERVFRSVLELDPDSVSAHHGLARSLFGRGEVREAASSAMDAIALRFDDTGSHFLLGVSLARLGETARAAQAFETCLALRPELDEARKALAALPAVR